MKETPQEKTAKIIIKRNAAEKVGKKLTMRNGMEAEIICYRNSADIDVRFEDGFVTTHTTYKNFCRRSVRNPNYTGYDHKKKSIKESREGEKQLMANGLYATIIEYRGYKDLDIKYSDGTIEKHCTYQAFLRGSSPKIFSASNVERVGERRKMNNGEWCEIIAYRSAGDIDVKFDDGTIVKSRMWAHFKDGGIKNPNTPKKESQKTRKCREKYVGKIYPSLCGLSMTIAAYRTANDVDVVFENGYKKSICNLHRYKRDA